MIVYHGSVLELKNPDAGHSKKYLDFGCGFYVTTYQPQAEKWALRKRMRLKAPAIVNVYEFDENIPDLNILKFENADGLWLDFVCSCRRGQDSYAEDIIIGQVADDDIFKTVNMYAKGLWDKERTIQELRYYKKNDQIAFKNDRAIQESLHFIRSYEVKNDTE